MKTIPLVLAVNFSQDDIKCEHTISLEQVSKIEEILGFDLFEKLSKELMVKLNIEITG